MDLCGICSVESKLLVAPNEIYLESYNLKRIMDELTQIEFTEEECSEAWICDVCADKLVDFHAFREKLFDFHKKLQQIRWTPDDVDLNYSEDLVKVEYEETKLSTLASELNEGSPGNSNVSLILESKEMKFEKNIEETAGNVIIDKLDPLLVQPPFLENRNVNTTVTRQNSSVVNRDRVPSRLTRICPLCFLQYRGAKGLRRHLRKTHAIDCSINGVQCERIICDKCKVPYSDLSSFEDHRCDEFMEALCQKRIPMDNLVCPGCSFVFKYADSFRIHTKSAYNLTDDIVDLFLRSWRMLNETLDTKGENQIAGSASSFSTGEHANSVESNVDLLTNIDVDKERPRGIKCPKCPRILENQLKLFDHQLFYHMKIGREIFQACPLCAQMIHMKDSWCSMKRHISTMHKEIEDEMREIRLRTGKILCPDCDEPFTDVATMYDHFKIQHTNNADGCNQDSLPIKCVWCEQRFKKIVFLQNHLESYHDRLPKTEARQKPSDSLLCTTCGKSFNQRHYLLSHLRLHTEDTPSKCSLCPAILKHKQALKRHIAANHRKTDKRRCDICGKDIIARNFGRHVKRHDVDNVKLHDCNVCGKQFNNSSNMRAHMWTHRDDFPFNCESCGKGFLRKKKLNEHTESVHQEHESGSNETEEGHSD